MYGIEAHFKFQALENNTTLININSPCPKSDKSRDHRPKNKV